MVGRAGGVRPRPPGARPRGPPLPSPLVARLADSAGFQWIARTVACERAGAHPATRPRDRDGEQVPAGQVAVDLSPTELHAGDQVLVGGRLVASPICATAGHSRCQLCNRIVTQGERSARYA